MTIEQDKCTVTVHWWYGYIETLNNNISIGG